MTHLPPSRPPGTTEPPPRSNGLLARSSRRLTDQEREQLINQELLDREKREREALRRALLERGY